MNDKTDVSRTDGNDSEKEVIKIDLDDSESDSNGNNSSQHGNSNENSDGQSDEKMSRTLKGIIQTSDMKFMSNFDPELSNREKRKLNRKLNLEGAGKRSTSLYDENGVLRGAGTDLCDCLVSECPGCHFPCPKCRSCKCGPECRVNRKWMYESIESEADKSVVKNPVQLH